jgi:hypothetical protein
MSKLKKRSERKLRAAARKLKKAKAIREEAKSYTGKKAGAMRTRAARKERRADEKYRKATGGKTDKQIKKENQKEFGRRGAKTIKLMGKRANLEGSPRRQKTRGKHLTKRINRLAGGTSWN